MSASTIRRPTERECQTTIIRAARTAGWLVHSQRPARTIQGWRTAIEGDPGFTDLVLVHPGRNHILFAELKRKPYKVTAEQERWHTAIDLAGGNISVVYVPDDMDRFIRWLVDANDPRVA